MLHPRLVLTFLPLLALAACSESRNDAANHKPPPEVSVMPITPADVPVSFEYIGQTAGSREVEVRARVTGYVEKRLYAEGALVKAGQPLFRLDARPLAAQVAAGQAAVAPAQADIARAEAAAAQTGRERERLAPLAAAHAVSRKEADDAASAEQIAQAEVQAAQARLTQAQAQLRAAQLDLEYATITAPVTGVAGRALRQEGALINANGDSLLTTLVQLDPLYVVFNVADNERQRMDQEIADGALKLPPGGFDVRLLQRDGTQIGQVGKVNYVSPAVNNQTGTLEMRGQLANPDYKLKSGLFVRVLLEGAIRPAALTVPQRAVQEGTSGKSVLVAVKNKDGQLVAEPRPIVVGEWTAAPGGEKAWVVKSGLKAGDQVIYEGLMKVFPGAAVSLGKPAQTAKPAQPAK
ncbi:MAG: efflux RND transporter periplasmic adaptor subunit [Methylobacillus sp.]|jgi:membrane fusion protein (multidrug efflux system)|nr:efflux RND transporter periplasmic adaptor subunit [Methylobacillus sp.]